MDKLILTTPEELKQLIYDSLEGALQKQNSRSATSSAEGFPRSKYLTVDEAAAYTHLSKQTIYRLTSTRTIPHIKPAQKLLFMESELDEWLLHGKKKSRNQIRDEIAGGTQKSA